MNYRSRASQGMAALILLAALFALRLERTHAFVAQPAPGKNYQLRLTHQTAHTFNDLEDEGEESLRVEETLMRTSRHPKVLRWREKLDRLKGLGPLEQLEAVNRMVNDDIHYRPDYSHWNRQDKWGFPLATLDEGGDCEDYAMLKRVSLHYLGWPEGGLYLLIGFSTFGSQPETHAVLMATLPDGSQLILDSLEKHVLPPSDDHHFNPMMALDRGSFYLVGREPAALPVSSTWKPAAGGTRALAGIFPGVARLP
jgi:predicted transglutaminase-like cysteine proteinase